MLRNVLRREKAFDLKYEKEGGLINESEYLNEVDFDHLKDIENHIMVYDEEENVFKKVQNPVRKMFNRVKDGEAVVKIQSEQEIKLCKEEYSKPIRADECYWPKANCPYTHASVEIAQAIEIDRVLGSKRSTFLI